MIVRSNRVFYVTEFLGVDSHRSGYVWSNVIPIIDELPGEDNKWPKTGRLGTLEECKPEDLQYAVHKNNGVDYFDLNIGDFILEENGDVVGTFPPGEFKRKFEEVK